MATYGNGRSNGKGHRARGANGSGRGQDRPAVSAAWARARRKRRERPKPSRWPAVILLASMLAIAALSVPLGATLVGAQAGLNAYDDIRRDLPPLSDLANHDTFKTAQIYDRKGRLLWEFYHQDGGRRTVVPIGDISQNLIDATLAAEDASFYTNPGVDARGIARALVLNFTHQSVVSGASTITQQLVRNVLFSPEERYEQTPIRKIREAILAYQVTQQFSKSQILEMYLNEIPYGHLAYGAEAASQTYFDKHARDLSVAEASLLAGLPQAPSSYDPFLNLDAARARQRYVLDQMTKDGFISQEQAEDAWNEKLTFVHHTSEILAPHWSQYVRNLVLEKYGERVLYQGGLKIYTTLDLDLQNRLQAVAQGNQDAFDKWHANNTTIVATDPRTGEILAMVGSRDYDDDSIDGQVNMALAERQPGSSIKPLVFAAAFDRGWGPYTIVDDKRTCWIENKETGQQWCPNDYDNTFRGPMTIRAALGNSINIPAVKALEFAGIDTVRDEAKRLGITTWDDKYLGLSLTLGGAEVRPLELTGAYGVFANDGLYVKPVAITKIVNAYGDVLEEYRVPQGDPVLDPRIAYQITNVLSDNNARLITYGPQNLLNDFDRPVAAKTGTTDNYRDTWTVGYTPSLVVGVWFGNTDGKPMVHAISSLSAGLIWHDAMKAAIDQLQLPKQEFPRPEGLIERDFCGPGISVCPYKELWLSERQHEIPKTPPKPTARPVSPTAVPPPAPAQPTPDAAQGGAQPPAGQPGPAQPAAEPTKRPAAAQPEQPAGGQPTPAHPAADDQAPPAQPAPADDQAPAAQPATDQPAADQPPPAQPPAAPPPAPATQPEPPAAAPQEAPPAPPAAEPTKRARG